MRKPGTLEKPHTVTLRKDLPQAFTPEQIRAAIIAGHLKYREPDCDCDICKGKVA